MINSITAINYLGEELTIDLTRPEDTGLFIKSVTGIGSGSANINTTDLASDDGGVFNSARAQTRNVVLNIGMYASPLLNNSIEDSRQLTYKYFAKKRAVRLVFNTDNRSLYIDGYVESNDPNIFSQEESTQISVLCPDPNFYKYSKRPSSVSFSGAEDLFEFPGNSKFIIGRTFTDKNGATHTVKETGEDPRWLPEVGYSNESLTDNLTEFGLVAKTDNRVLLYDAEIGTGITIYIHPKAAMTGFGIYNVETGEKIEIDDDAVQKITGSTIAAGDEITIVTIKGKKSATLLRNGTTYNIINALGRNPDWFQVYQGENVFAIDASEEALDSIELYIYYVPAYEGV